MKPFLRTSAADARRRRGSRPRSRRGRARGPAHGAGARLRMPHIDAVHQCRHRLADRGPVRLGVVAGARSAPARSAFEPRLVAQLGQPGPAQQRPQRRIAERGPIELGRDAGRRRHSSAAGVADVIERRAVLPGRQRPEGGAGKILKAHEIFAFGRRGRPAALPIWRHPKLKSLKKLSAWLRDCKCDWRSRKKPAR